MSAKHDDTRRHGMTQEQIDAVRARYGVGPHLAADLVVVTTCWREGSPDMRVLLIRRGNPPYQGHDALPGGFVDLDEDLEHAARRELVEETGIRDLGDAAVEQLGTYGNPNRDPRSRVVSVVHLALVRWEALAAPSAGDDASDARFVAWRDGVAMGDDGEKCDMAFDHDRVLADAWERLRMFANYTSIPLALLPSTFSSDQAEGLYGVLRGDASLGVGVMGWLEGQGWVERTDRARWRAVVQGTRWAPPPRA